MVSLSVPSEKEKFVLDVAWRIGIELLDRCHELAPSLWAAIDQTEAGKKSLMEVRSGGDWTWIILSKVPNHCLVGSLG